MISLTSQSHYSEILGLKKSDQHQKNRNTPPIFREFYKGNRIKFAKMGGKGSNTPNDI